ncbi:aminoglycoside N(3)-acetyltransferase [Sphingosinicella terrae]|uniref:aminoglycoside N(3)-acetyltransferase n=1 Tax=Sphingosinicella terrae TaxID=2172047 RepID=UPI000E0CFD06|nr:AAC(3) family N-acetyltransferase [Sphingosinicella terrae]
MVHASLRTIGLAGSHFGPGGAEMLLDVLESVVGPAGTLMMVIGTDYALDWVNRRPQADRAALLEGTDPIDLAAAAANPELGWLAEAFRQRPGTIVSHNPSGRFAARGARAEELMHGHPWNDYYGAGSPLHKLCEQGGSILRLGADRDTVTALHYAEYVARLPDKRRTRWDYRIATPAGPRHLWVECLDDDGGIRSWQDEDYFAVILKKYLSSGRARMGWVGEAPAELIEAADIVRFGAKWMEDNLR